MPKKNKTEEKKPRRITRWKFKPGSPVEPMLWEVRDRKTGKWTPDDRDFPELTQRALMKRWIWISENAKPEDRAISEVCRYFNVHMTKIKRMRTHLNKELGGEYLRDMPDWTPYEQRRVDSANKKTSVQDIFDSLPKSLKEQALNMLNPDRVLKDSGKSSR